MPGSQAVWRVTCHGGLAPWQVKLALRLLLNDLSSGQSVKQVATHCGLSRSHFEKAFKASLGTPPHRWRVRQRVQRAARNAGADERQHRLDSLELWLR